MQLKVLGWERGQGSVREEGGGGSGLSLWVGSHYDCKTVWAGEAGSSPLDQPPSRPCVAGRVLGGGWAIAHGFGPYCDSKTLWVRGCWVPAPGLTPVAALTERWVLGPRPWI